MVTLDLLQPKLGSSGTMSMAMSSYGTLLHLFPAGGIAAYNSGTGRITDPDQIDKRTTKRDYSNDVVARAQHLITKYKWYTE